MARYVPVKQQLWHEQLGVYDTYALRVENEAGECLAQIDDVSTDYVVVGELAEKCNRGQPDLVHLKDVVLNHL